MFGKGVFHEEENLLRDIIRSIDKRLDYSAKEGAGTRFTVHIKLRGHEADVMLDLEDLKAARTDMVKRQQIRHKIKARCDHLDKSRYGDDVLGLKSARILRASPKPEAPIHRGGFGRSPRR
jgi:hypothetical protein